MDHLFVRLDYTSQLVAVLKRNPPKTKSSLEISTFLLMNENDCQLNNHSLQLYLIRILEIGCRTRCYKKKKKNLA